MKNKAKVMQLIGMAVDMPDVGVEWYAGIQALDIKLWAEDGDNMNLQCVRIEYSTLSGAVNSHYYYTAEEAINLLKFIAENGRAS